MFADGWGKPEVVQVLRRWGGQSPAIDTGRRSFSHADHCVNRHDGFPRASAIGALRVGLCMGLCSLLLNQTGHGPAPTL